MTEARRDERAKAKAAAKEAANAVLQRRIDEAIARLETVTICMAHRMRLPVRRSSTRTA